MANDPGEAAEPLAWERPKTTAVRRFFGTLASAFRPVRSVPAFAGDDIQPAIRFALWTALPLAMLGGVIPFTETLLFGPSLSLQPIDDPSRGRIAWDVARALFLGALTGGIHLAALGVPYVTLVRSYGRTDRTSAAVRAVLYRAWLVTLSAMLVFVTYWVAPEGAEQKTVLFARDVVVMVPWILLFLTLRATARMVCAVGPLASFVVVIVPFVLWELVRGLLIPLLGVGVGSDPGPAGG